MTSLEEQRVAIRRWIDGIKARNRIEISDIATAARVSTSTIYRWFDDNHPFNPSTTAISKIARAFDTPMPIGGLPGSMAVQEEAVRYVPGADAKSDPVVKALLSARPHACPWVVKGDMLMAADIREGDILVVDPDVSPANGDIVCANVTDRFGASETWFRVYQHPNIVPAFHDARRNKPEQVDNDRIVIWGTMTDLLRRRAA